MASDEDKALFRRMMQDVTPLKQQGKPAPKAPRQGPVLRPPAPETIQHLSNYYCTTLGPESLLSYCHPHAPKKRFQALQAGHIPWTAKLDLHGQTVDRATGKFLQFINQAVAEGHRSLLIIHGKGQLREEASILKNLTNHWLQQLPFVLAFHSAQPKDGGRGAVYVLLKQKN